jgi:AcrR family transcriptional regulator
VATLLKNISDEIYAQQREDKEQQDNEFLLTVRMALGQLELLGEKISLPMLAQKLEIPKSHLKRIPQIKEFIEDSNERINTARKQREQQELTGKLQVAIQELEACGQPLNKASIAKKLGVGVTFLDRKPYIANFIDRSALKVKRRQQHEEVLVTRVEDAIEQLSAEGKSITYQAIEKEVGVNRKHLRTYPRVKTLIERSLCSWALNMSRSLKRREEGELLAKIEAAVEQFKVRKQAITLSAICDTVGISKTTLKEYPSVSSLLDKCIEEYYQTLKKQTQIHGENLKSKVEQVACELEAQGKIVTIATIADVLGMDDSNLMRYPSVQMFFQQYQAAHPRYLQREKQLMEKAKAAIQQLGAQGHPYSMEAMCHEIGCSRDCLAEYPKVEDLVKQSIEVNRTLRLQRMFQNEADEIDQIKSAIQQLEAQGHPITLEAVSRIIGKSRKKLYYHPNVVAFLKNEVKERSPEFRMRKRQMREDALVEIVREAREQLQILGIPFSGRALVEQVRISYQTFLRYPRVREMLNQFRQEFSQMGNMK